MNQTNAQATESDSGEVVAANPHLRRELLKMLETDQAIRNELLKKGAGHLDEMILKRINATDAANLTRVKAIIKRHGFPSLKLMGKDRVEAAFILV